MIRHGTPIEEHRVGGRRVYVKRDDLCAAPPAPPLGKLRGLRLLLERHVRDGTTLVGCWDTRVSKLGQGVAACCREFAGLRCIVSYPSRSGAGTPPAVEVAAALGAEVHVVPGSRLTIAFARAREYVHARGGVMLPFGLECPEAVEGVRQEAADTPPELLAGGTLVVSCGSGVTLAGLLLGLPVLPAQIVGVSAGRSVRQIGACILRHCGGVPDVLELVPADRPYAAVPEASCPFPAHPNYDLKAWKHLVDHLEHFASPVLFWNIGA
jgi:1-aminocyclopropane-1-carboxylate deaminase/D-cysteine desulfhydrase-like pyridoxal-dependent ACC family enzyme